MRESLARAPRILPPRGLALSLLAQVPLALLGWPWRPGWPWLLAGGLALAVGATLNLWADAAFRRDRVPVCPFHSVPVLIEDGPFRFTRNPMYLGMVLLSASFALLAAVPWNLVAAAAFGAWLHLRFVLPEEAFLREQLGSGVDAYLRRVPRWIGWGRPAGRGAGRPQSSRASSSGAPPGRLGSWGRLPRRERR